MAILFDTGIFSVIGVGSALLPGAKLNFYTTGTSARLDTFTTRALDPALKNTNPVVADANGRFGPIWLQAADYKLVLTDASGVVLVTSDPVPGGVGASSVTVTLNGTGAVSQTVDNILNERVSVSRFGVVGDGTDESVNLQKALNYIATNGGVLHFPVPSVNYSFATGLTYISPRPLRIEGEAGSGYTKTASSTGQVRLNYTGSAGTPALKIESNTTVGTSVYLKNLMLVAADQAKGGGGVGLAMRACGLGEVNDLTIAGFATGLLMDDNPIYSGATAHPVTYVTFNRLNISRAAKQRVDIRGAVGLTFNQCRLSEESLAGYDYDLTIAAGTNLFRSDSHTFNSCAFIGVGANSTFFPSKNVRVINSLFNTFNQCDFEQSTVTALEVVNTTVVTGAVINATINNCWFNGNLGYDIDSQFARTVINNVRSATATGNLGPNIRFVGDPTGATQPDIGGGIFGGIVSYGGTVGIQVTNATGVVVDKVNITDALARSSQAAVELTSSAHKCRVDVRLGASTGAITDAALDNIVVGPYTTSYVPTVTSVTGALTTKSATFRYTRNGNTIHFQSAVTITTNGTGATAVRITLPINAVATTVVAGRQTTGGTGLMLQGVVTAASNLLDITTSTNVYPAADGYVLTVSGSYEVA